MKTFSSIFLLISLLASKSEGAAFTSVAVFGVRGGGRGGKSEATEEPDPVRAEKAIWDAVMVAEDKVQKIVSDEVDALFHGHEDKELIAEKTKKAIKKSAEKVKAKKIQDHLSASKKDKTVDHKDYHILHAVESAEHAFLHAIEDEVDTLFQQEEHHDEETKAKAKESVKSGVKKAKQKVEDDVRKRREWLDGNREVLFEEYSCFIGM